MAGSAFVANVGLGSEGVARSYLSALGAVSRAKAGSNYSWVLTGGRKQPIRKKSFLFLPELPRARPWKCLTKGM